MRAPRSSRDEPGETVDAPRTAGTTLVRAWGVPQGGRGGAWCDRGGTPALGVSRALEAPASRKRDTDSAGNPRDRDTRTYTGARTHTGALMDDDTAHQDTAPMEVSHRRGGASGPRNGRRGGHQYASTVATVTVPGVSARSSPGWSGHTTTGASIPPCVTSTTPRRGADRPGRRSGAQHPVDPSRTRAQDAA